MTTPADVYWDPYDIEIDSDPYEIWRELRDVHPLYRNERHDFWALSRFADVEAASRDPRTYSSAHGTVLEVMADGMDDMMMMIFMDPPSHTRMRALVSRAFTPRRMTLLEDRIRDLCVGFLDEVDGRDGFDYVADFGARLPAMVIASLLGVPEADQADVRTQIDLLFHLDPETGMVNDVSLGAMFALNDYISAELEERRRSPRDDMFTDLVEAEITEEDGTTRRLTTPEAAAFGLLIINAGTETVARLLGGRRSCWASIRTNAPRWRLTCPSCPTRWRSSCASRPRHRFRVAG